MDKNKLIYKYKLFLLDSIKYLKYIGNYVYVPMSVYQKPIQYDNR